MAELFEIVQINKLKLKNRAVLSGAFGAENPSCKFESLAKGEVGLIITGGSRLDEIAHFEKIVKAVHDCQGKVAIQLVSQIGGQFGFIEDTIAVSELKEDNIFFNPLIRYCKHHAATEEEMEKIINFFAESAFLAKSIGADAVQIHSAHQSFLSQFLSPITNKRSDRWGGSLENRTLIHKAIYQAMRARIGADFPILIKLGVEDALDCGLKFKEGKEIAKLIASYGYDAIEISQGLQDFNRIFQNLDWSGTPMHTDENEAYFRNWTKEIKKLVSIPIIMTGGIKSYEIIQEVLKNNETDLIGICRPLIREPDLIHRWRIKDLKKASCISCNKCITEILMKGEPLECYLDRAR